MEKAGEYRGDTLATTYVAQYSYDRWGNRFQNPANQQSVPSYVPVVDAEVDKATNRFVASTGIVYDEAGNMTLDAKFRMRQYRYDANGRQTWTKLSNGTGLAAVSVYDGNGQRVATQVNGQWRYVVFDAFGQMVAEYGGAPTGGTGGVRYLMTDHQGSTRLVMNSNSAASSIVSARYDYQPFGEAIGAGVGRRNEISGYDATDGLRQRYALTERDEATGLDHTWFRKYENQSGRWTSPDPLDGNIQAPQSFNRYAYTGNDPINLVDPTGLMWIVCYLVDTGDGVLEGYCVAERDFGYVFPDRPGPGDPSIDPAIVEQAYRDCISELFPQYALESFTPTTGGADGVTRIRDVSNGVQTNIVNDSTPPNSVRADMIAHDARGSTDHTNPWWTWVISSSNSPALRPGEVRYPDLFLAPGMDWVRTQMHETAAALTITRDMYYPGPWAPRLPDGGLDPSHPDNGPSMEDCVGRKVYAKLGLTPVT